MLSSPSSPGDSTKFSPHVSSLTSYQKDAGIAADNVRLIKTTVEAFGGLDIIIANAGWTKFEKFGDLSAMTDEDWNKVSKLWGACSRLLIPKVLDHKCHFTYAAGERSHANLQRKSRRRGVFDNVLGGSEFPLQDHA